MSTNRSSGSLSSMSKLSTSLPIGNSVYDKVYRAIEFLSTDPHQDVSGMSQTLVIFLRQKVKSKDALSRPSLSIPAPLFNEALSAVSTTSEPSSPAKHSTPPPSGSDGVSTISKPSVSTIKEEECVPPSTSLSSLSRKSSRKAPNSATHPRLAKGGRHPSGQQQHHQPTLGKDFKSEER